MRMMVLISQKLLPPLPQSELIQLDSPSWAFESEMERPHKLAMDILHLPLQIHTLSFSALLCALGS